MRKSLFYAIYTYNLLFTQDISTKVPKSRALVAYKQATTIKVVRDKLIQYLQAIKEY